MAAQNELFAEIEDTVWRHFEEELPTKSDIEAFVSGLLAFHLDLAPDKKYAELKESLDREQFTAEIVEKYWKDQSVKQNIAHYLIDSDDNTPWLPQVEENIEWHYWNQYRRYLEQKRHWSREVCDTIGKDTFEILSKTADPNASVGFKKKGLVVGNVQSGKTANYLGLMCRAADAGYNFIVVLAAMTNDLRSQTQQRIEEGFIGYECQKGAKNQSPLRMPVGVGEMHRGSFRHPNPGTTRADDFKAPTMRALLQVSAENTTEPWVFVCKKNASTLKNLIHWLKTNLKDVEDPSLFLIDDEADNASINTKHDKEEVSRINGQIRDLLSMFEKNVYVGYTATPYANILIDKDDDDDELGTDLFPRNFIFTLSAADSYFGADEIFSDIEPDDEQYIEKPKYIRFIDDIALMPPGKKDYDIDFLPPSVLDAVRTFVVSSALRVKEAGSDCHTTMLFNTSPYNAVQKKLKLRVDEYISDVLKPAIASYGALDPDAAIRQSSEIKALRERWDYEFEGKSKSSWQEIFPFLFCVVNPLRTVLINSKSKDALEYNSHIEHVIAFGGYRLSRGLTLEGLITSYFSRNSRAYDTLMQMSRWFGHRPGYEYLCRIWMTRESAGWCKFVADATNDLIDDLIVMQHQDRTPLEFGHKIRSHPGTLMVTARNKMGGGKLVHSSCLSGKLIETTVLPRKKSDVDHNIQAANTFKKALEDSTFNYSFEQISNPDGIGAAGALFKGVPYKLVDEFVLSFVNHDDSMLTKVDKVSEYIELCREEGFKTWDVFFAAASGDRHDSEKMFNVNGNAFYCERRKPGVKTMEDRVYIGNRHKVSSKGVDKIGLSLAARTLAEGEYITLKESGSPRPLDKLYRERREAPLLVIHYLDVSFKKGSDEYDKATGKIKGGDMRFGALPTRQWPEANMSEDQVAWSISFPPLSRDRCVEYVFNKVALEEMYFGEDVEDEDEGIDFDD